MLWLKALVMPLFWQRVICIKLPCIKDRASSCLDTGQMAESKQKVISNENLARLGYWIKIAAYMNTGSNFTDWGSGKYSQVGFVCFRFIALAFNLIARALSRLFLKWVWSTLPDLIFR